MLLPVDALRVTVRAVPAVIPYLSHNALFAIGQPSAYKSQEYFIRQIRGLVTSLYNNLIGGGFIDTMANLISGQLRDAYERAWEDRGDGTVLPAYLVQAWEADVLKQYDHVDQYFRDIIDARIDQTTIDPLLYRAELWGNRWQESYNNAVALIAETDGLNLLWKYGDTDHCETCRQLDGIVASKRDWDSAGVKPQNAPNNLLECGGWRCQCTLTPTDRRRSPDALGRILNAVTGGML